MPTFQEQFQQYLSNSYYPNDPTLNQGGEPNVVEPINTFDVSPELKKKLKKQRKTISPIRQYENDTLQFDETTGTGQFDFSDPFKLFNIAAQGITGFANANNDAKNRRLEEQMYLQSLIPKPSFNYNEDGLNNIPMYKGGGQNPAKVYTDRKQFEQAQRMYNDSLLSHKYGEDWFNVLKYKNFNVTEAEANAIRKGIIAKHPGIYDSKTMNNPISSYTYNIQGVGDIGSYRFKKPVQPVVYQPQRKSTPTNSGFTNTPTPYGARLLEIPKGDKESDYEVKTYFNPISQNRDWTYVKKKPTHPIQNMKRINPQQMDLSSKVNIQGQQIPMPAFQFPQQKGNPVYGPGNTIVGYSDNMNFKPAYEYTGAPNSSLNLQDKELLNNPEALRKYILSKDNYKFPIEEFKDGGKKESKQAAAWRILRDGKANGKKLTDKQKKFFLAMGRAKFPDGGINTTNIDPGWGNPKYGPVLPNFGGDPGWGDPKYGPDLPEFYGDPGWGNPAFYPRQQQINMNGQWVPQAILDYKALQSNSISNSKGTTNLGWNMINDWAQKAFKNPRYVQSAIAQEKLDDEDWHHNVDNIDFPGYGMTPLDPKNSKYFQDEAFIGPPNYPTNLQGVSNPQWNFKPVRVDYNQKYIPYQANYNKRPYLLKKDFNNISKQLTIDNIINTAQELGVTTPINVPITGKKLFMDPNNPTLATPQNDIWNNPNGSDPVQAVPIQYEKDDVKGVKSWFASGGYNEGDEVDIDNETLKKLQELGYRFEIL